jgi:hypothetical protein
MKLKVEIFVYCQCGLALECDVDYDTKWDFPHIRVEPCAKCTADSVEEIMDFRNTFPLTKKREVYEGNAQKQLFNARA